MTTALPQYEGWANRPTWSVNLWLTNEQYTEQELRAICNRGTGTYDASNELREWVESMMDDTIAASSLQSDLLSWTLAYVDWQEIVEAHREEEEQGVCTYCGTKYAEEDAEDGYCDECRTEANAS